MGRAFDNGIQDMKQHNYHNIRISKKVVYLTILVQSTWLLIFAHENRICLCLLLDVVNKILLQLSFLFPARVCLQFYDNSMTVCCMKHFRRWFGLNFVYFPMQIIHEITHCDTYFMFSIIRSQIYSKTFNLSRYVLYITLLIYQKNMFMYMKLGIKQHFVSKY